MSDTVILVSPAAVDAYPPVQYQARLLADSGTDVELITRRLPQATEVKFQHPGVKVTSLKAMPRGLSRPMHFLLLLKQLLHFAVAVTFIRLRHRTVSAEIAFDPDGIFISDYALFRPKRRIAHLHEIVQRMGKSPLETRLRRALPHYRAVVVADVGRAAQLRDQTGLAALPWVTPNYPLKEPSVLEGTDSRPGFEVIYGGALGPDQMIDLIICSVPLWPKEAYLTLIGDDTKPMAMKMKVLAASAGVEDRVSFTGWMGLDQIIGRYRQAHLAISLISPEQAQVQSNVGASNKRYQFMQAGLPQIGDMTIGLTEVLDDNGIGRCVTEYSEQAIADLVKYYMDHPAERLEAGRRAEQLHYERYNYQIAFEPTLRWIQEGIDP